MFPALEQLLVVQDRDRTIFQLRAEQRRIPLELESLQRKLAEETATLDTFKNQTKQNEADRKKLELDAESKRQLIAKYKTQQGQVKKNDEYQALTHEIENAEAAIREIEDRELEIMDAAEHIQQQFRQQQTLLSETTAFMNKQKADLEKRAAAIAAQLATVEAERAKLVETVDAALLSRYQRILDKRQDFAVVQVLHDSCGGCHLKLPPQTIHLANGGKELAACDFCGRLLYWLPQ